MITFGFQTSKPDLPVMEAKHEDLIASLRTRLMDLIELYERAKMRSHELEEENQKLKGMLSEKEKTVTKLEKELNNVKFAESIAVQGGDAQAAKQTINQIVREIDNCIALLNK
jgi:predicted RNase H-like nuclease (RuvC/YqgF family)